MNAVENNVSARRVTPESTSPNIAVPTIGVLALQGAVREHLAVLASIGVAAIEVRNAQDLARVDGLILPGGESTTISMLIESAGLLPALTERLDAGMPAFGTCAGMILLAADVADGRADQHFFGAIDIGVRRNAFGRQIDSFETDLVVAGLDAPLHAVFIRAPVVERVGDGVEVLATVDGFDGALRPVVCRQGSVLVVAFHPELAADPRLHQLFVEAVAEAMIDEAVLDEAALDTMLGSPGEASVVTGVGDEELMRKEG